MPPVMKCREDVEHILSDNPEIDGFEEHRYVFTDISYNLPDRVCFMYNFICHVPNKEITY